MLVEKDYTGKKKSKYICDRCGKSINTDTEKRYKIGIDTPKNYTSEMKIVRTTEIQKRLLLTSLCQ